MRDFTKSKQAFAESSQLMPGGVNSPVRAFKNVGGDPLFIDHGKGSHIYDIDGNDYIDYVMSWGPLILGHADDQVVADLQAAVTKGTSYGAPTLLESQLAKMIQKVVPSIEMMRMVSSGTEATMSAIRLARGYTKRDKIVKFIGNYHGHSDSLLVDAGSGLATFNITKSPGVPEALAYDTLTVAYNDEAAIKKVFAAHGDEIACVIVEPVAGNMGVIPAKKSFLQTLRQVTSDHGALLIFDEVMTGFRAAFHGAQALYGITPDLTTLGKVVGGGLPVGVFGGRREIMHEITPDGPIYHAGTLSGNPLAMTGGISTIKQLNEDLYTAMDQKVTRLMAGIAAAAKQYQVPIVTHHVGTMWSYFFNEHEVENFADVQKSDQAYFAKFYKALLQEGIYTAPSQFETNFISTKHTDAEIDQTIAAFERAFAAVSQG
ncbi:glutamate-1-semialdehyde 2,1-aminomutase [Loigolactobacillus coryniformis]|jgi:glutamate-1-semialdehyde 2,1-aminomutase|uniref:Glutamate-1-semialdehyde 2,1-aminomutase n=3 Tax=Loigolactobacillus coryniformis TaxID=1610 RepID=J3JCI6_9LACO|nr:glutamate-1-semialdehyde 2,1-aminomutase [Loigolactobacillus coryniformis]MDT3391062.1 glutamate-1-semialdehyde 2,1-aminomutase [Bacillota bacterium]OEH89702.1 glutamate-1-semialdehyde aminotransferase [Loigolactobacillus coryniformis subsp. coryniformis]ATO43154.1 glutamate-1-semialdehyde-2,1-aminomutase [Loigolactobacillus coryniformis subsp. torquens DSM 20004 = KCTC 3535]ATO54910.1 glutamate-1-semialdehyde-2,1-aminomutase [Loigolactobacillus coryniformis subsp. coryniformis KCTC 3167 = D